MLSIGGFRYSKAGERHLSILERHLPFFLPWLRLCTNPPMQHGTCLRHVAYCHASATSLLIIDVNLRNSPLIGKCKKSRSWAKSTPKKPALETPLRKLGHQNFYTMSSMNVSEKSPNFKKLTPTVFCSGQKNYRWGPIRPPPTGNRVTYSGSSTSLSIRFDKSIFLSCKFLIASSR